MKIVLLLMISVLTMACLGNRSGSNLNKIMGVLKQVPEFKNQWEIIYPQRFLRNNTNLEICPTNIEFMHKTNANVGKPRQIEVDNKVIGYKYKLTFVGKPVHDDNTLSNIILSNNILSNIITKIVGPGSVIYEYDIVVLTAKSKESINKAKEEYPNIEPPQNLNCIGCNNSDQPIILIHSKGNPDDLALHLTSSSDQVLEFSSLKGESITLVPLEYECPSL